MPRAKIHAVDNALKEIFRRGDVDVPDDFSPYADMNKIGSAQYEKAEKEYQHWQAIKRFTDYASLNGLRLPGEDSEDENVMTMLQFVCIYSEEHQAEWMENHAPEDLRAEWKRVAAEWEASEGGMLQRIMKSSAADATKWAKRQTKAVQAQFARVQTQWRKSRRRYIEGEAAVKSGIVEPILRAASPTGSTLNSLKYKHVVLTASGIFRAAVWMNGEPVGLGSFRDEMSAARSAALALNLHHEALQKSATWERPDMTEWYAYVLTKFPDSQCAAPKKKKVTAKKRPEPAADYYVRTPLRHVTIASSVSY